MGVRVTNSVRQATNEIRHHLRFSAINRESKALRKLLRKNKRMVDAGVDKATGAVVKWNRQLNSDIASDRITIASQILRINQEASKLRDKISKTQSKERTQLKKVLNTKLSEWRKTTNGFRPAIST